MLSNCYLIRGVFETMDLTKNISESVDSPSFFQPPDANDCGKKDCPNCAMLMERLKQLSYCLAVAQRLTNLQA